MTNPVISELEAIRAEQELLPCPFCGDKDDYNPSVSPLHGYAQEGDAVSILQADGKALTLTDYYVECDKCAGCGPPQATEAEAIKAWNTRYG